MAARPDSLIISSAFLSTITMNPSEYQLLLNPRLSHPARTLYTLFLRRQAENGHAVRVSYPDLGRALAVEDPVQPGGFAYQVNASQLTRLFDELLGLGLLDVLQKPHPDHYHTATLTLPWLAGSNSIEPLAQPAHAMHTAWRPDTRFAALAQLTGLLDANYDEIELGEFIAYWLGRPEVFANDHQWMLKFIKALKARRYSRGSSQPMVGTGYQQVPETSQSGPSKRALEMMAEAQQLQPNAAGEPDGKDGA